jgi:hypothetical protein
MANFCQVNNLARCDLGADPLLDLVLDPKCAATAQAHLLREAALLDFGIKMRHLVWDQGSRNCKATPLRLRKTWGSHSVRFWLAGERHRGRGRS